VLRAALALALVPIVAPFVPWMVLRSRSPESFTGHVLILVGIVVWAFALRRAASGRADGADDGAGDGAAIAAVVGGGVISVAAVVVDVRLLGAWAALLMVWGVQGAFVQRSSSPTSSTTIIAAGLVAIGLPLSGDIDVVGFPLRQLSAQLAAVVLPFCGTPVVFAETVLRTESGIADVEAPCAGLSTIRLLIATVLVAGGLLRPSLKRVVAAVVVAVVVAVVGNATRVTVLSALVLGHQHHEAARIVHVPLGVLVFAVSAACALWLLLHAPPPRPSSARPAPPLNGDGDGGGAKVIVMVTALVAVVATAVAVSALRVQRADGARVVDDDGSSCNPHEERILSTLGVDVPLEPAEHALFDRHALLASKRRLEADGLPRGEVLIVKSGSLRAMHAPERCLSGAGHRVLDVATVSVGGLQAKRLLLDGGALVALSFMLSVDDHGVTRTATSLADVVAARLAGHRRPWVFVSAVTDGAGAGDEAALLVRLQEVARQIVLPAGPFAPASTPFGPGAHAPPILNPDALGAP
jgi:exosortase O